MPVVKHEAFFRRHPVFTGDELAAYLTSRGEVGARGQEALLAYYTKTRRIVRVRRGLYAVVPPGANPKAYPIDPYLVAAKLNSGRGPVPSHGARISRSGLLGLAPPNLLGISSGGIADVPLSGFPGSSQGTSPLRDRALWRTELRALGCGHARLGGPIARACREAGRKSGARWNRSNSSTSTKSWSTRSCWTMRPPAQRWGSSSSSTAKP